MGTMVVDAMPARKEKIKGEKENGKEKEDEKRNFPDMPR